jgi:hypothetical protein
MKHTRFKNISVAEYPGRRGVYGYVKNGDILKCVLFGRKRIRRAREIFNLLLLRNADLEKLDDRFFSILSLYLCEEKYLDTGLLDAALGGAHDVHSC